MSLPQQISAHHLAEQTNHALSSNESDELTNFKARQKEYFSGILERKWECAQPGHTVCVPTVDGQHYQLSEEQFVAWVETLCVGDATTAQPPQAVLGYPSASDGSYTSWIHQAVPVPPSWRRNAKCQTLAASASMRHTLEASVSSWPSSGVPGVGYHSGKAIKWLGQRTLNALEQVVILKRTYQHRYRLNRWKEKDIAEISWEMQTQLLNIIEDALEMSRPCYSPRVNRFAASIGWEMHLWIGSHSRAYETKVIAPWLGLISVCLPPPFLVGKSQSERPVCDLACELLETLTKVPLSLQGPETTSEIIYILARELAYSPYILEHSWMGTNLIRIVESTCQMRPLTALELGAIRDMAVRRLARSARQEEDFCRPWEVALFSECASQDTWFMEVVHGLHGLQSLAAALSTIPLSTVLSQDEMWLHTADILSALVSLFRHAWVTRAAEPEIMHSLLNILKLDVPTSWCRIRFWTIFAICNIVRHRPPMLRCLMVESAVPAFRSIGLTALPHGATQMEEHDRKLAKKAAKHILNELKTNAPELWYRLYLTQISACAT